MALMSHFIHQLPIFRIYTNDHYRFQLTVCSPFALVDLTSHSPLITSNNNLNASTAKLTIFSARSFESVSISLVNVPSGVATAKATYPLCSTSALAFLGIEVRGKTYGVRFRLEPPVGPAVPDSHTVYVLPSFARTFSASLETTERLGPV